MCGKRVYSAKVKNKVLIKHPYRMLSGPWEGVVRRGSTEKGDKRKAWTGLQKQNEI